MPKQGLPQGLTRMKCSTRVLLIGNRFPNLEVKLETYAMSNEVKVRGTAKNPRGSPTFPTIRDVARAAGVSLGTASKALNGQGRLRLETRARVQAAAQQLGFRPNDLAQSLPRKRTFTVGLISTDSYGRFSMPLLEGIEHALGSEQISVFLCNAADDSTLEQQHVNSLLAKRVDGIIVTSRRTDPRTPLNVAGAKLPVIYAYAQVEDSKATCLLPDDFQGGRLATEHLVKLGRKRIAHVTGPERFEAVRQRREAWRKVLEEKGLEVPLSFALSGSWSEAWGHEAVRHLLNKKTKPDAIFCGSDQIARGVADALREHGVRVPEDIALVGYDNWEIIAAATRPSLTTVDMNMRELGRQAALQLLGLIDGKNHQGIQHLPCHLVVRESCGAKKENET
jgi:LacI family transcriptional regulator